MQERADTVKQITLVINEIFHSIQGESSNAGRPCVFVRLTYCNLRCSYCDTEYAFFEGHEMSLDEIMKEIGKYRCRLVEVTGGEPLLQPDVHGLMKGLCDGGYEVLLETGGSLDISRVDPRVKRIVDFKCPSSMMSKNNLLENVEHLKDTDEVKFVICDRGDYEWSKEMIEKNQISGRCQVLMSAAYGRLEPVRLAEWLLQDGLDVRLELQMHKYLWEPGRTGV